MEQVKTFNSQDNELYYRILGSPQSLPDFLEANPGVLVDNQLQVKASTKEAKKGKVRKRFITLPTTVEQSQAGIPTAMFFGAEMSLEKMSWEEFNTKDLHSMYVYTKFCDDTNHMIMSIGRASSVETQEFVWNK